MRHILEEPRLNLCFTERCQWLDMTKYHHKNRLQDLIIES